MKILTVGVGIRYFKVSSASAVGITVEVWLDLIVTMSFRDSVADDLCLLKVNNILFTPS